MTETQIEAPTTRGYPATRRTPNKSFPSQVVTALLQPVYFFRTLPEMYETRQWLWATLMILALVAFSTIRQQELSGTESGGTDTAPIDGGFVDPGMIPPVDGGFPPVDGGMGGPPVDGMPPVVGGAGTETNVTATWTTAVITGSGVLVHWFLLSVLLSLVSLFNGGMPKLSRNFQIAVWASLPLALMAVLQLLYYSAGGEAGRAGVSGVLLDNWDGFSQQQPVMQSFLLSAASLVTVFWLWSLMMIYFGARFGLRGKRWSSVLVVVLWVALMVLLPVATGAITPPETMETIEDPGMTPLDPLLDPSLSDPFASPDGEVPRDGGEMGNPDGEFNPEMELSETPEAEVIPDEEFEAGETPTVEAETESRPEKPPQGRPGGRP